MKKSLLLLTLTATAAGAWALLPTPRALAQEASASYSPLMSRDRVTRWLDAVQRKSPYVAGEILVKFRDGSRPADQARALSVLRSVDTTQSRWIGEVLLVDAPGEPDASRAAAVVATQPEVEWAQPNWLRRYRATPNDPTYASQWNFAAIDMPRAWDINPGASANIKVAVLDTGVTAITQTFSFKTWTGSQFETLSVPFGADPDIRAARILPGRDFVLWSGPVFDSDGHGSHVAGTILQETNNNFGPAGIAYAATLLPVKVCLSHWDLQFLQGFSNTPGFVDPDDEGYCDDGALADGMRYAADQGAQIINVSIGGEGAAPILLDAMRYAVAHGAFISIAAGNDFEEGNPMEFPAAYAPQVNGAVAVGAVGRSLRRAFYSSTGTYVELAAPGGDDTDGGTSGMIWQMTLLPGDSDPRRVTRPRFDRYTTIAYQGTSMAAPHAAGAAALLYSQGITSPAAIESALEQFATDLGVKGRDNEYGFGLISPRASLRGLGLAK